MLDELVVAAKQIVNLLFERGSSFETGVVVAFFVLIVLVVLKFVSKPLTGTRGRAFFVLIPGFVLMLAAAAAVRAFVSDSALYQALAALIVLLVVVLPLTQAIQDTSYLCSFFLWAVLLLTAVAVFTVESALAGVIHKGAGRGSSLRQHRNQMDEYFKETGK